MGADVPEGPSWYVAVDKGQPLEQGDILRDCPIPIIPDELPTTKAVAEMAELVISFSIADIIILSQACDITVQNKQPRRINDIVVCPAWELPKLQELNSAFENYDRIDSIVRGRVVQWHALAPCGIAGLERTYTFLELGRMFVLPVAHLEAVAGLQPKRLRLLSPWREHMSHAVAELLGRPAIPLPAPAPPRPPKKPPGAP